MIKCDIYVKEGERRVVMKKKNPFFTVVFICCLMLITTGCGIVQYIQDHFITIEQIVEQSLQKMEQPSGVRTVVKEEEKQTLLRNGQLSQLRTQMILKQSFSDYPLAIHSISQYKTQEHPFRSEFYFVNGVIYQQNGSSGWQKSMAGISQLNLTYDPIYMMRSLKQEIHKKDIKMDLAGNDYVLIINQQTAHNILKPFYKDFTASYRQIGIDNPQGEEKSIHTESFSQRLFINKYSMHLRKMTMHVKLKTEMKGLAYTVEYKSNTDVQGRAKKSVTVPKMVQKDAVGFEK